MSGKKEFVIDELSVRYKDGKLSVLDQTKLPDEELWVPVETLESMFDLIKRLAVRGAPLIAVGAALALLVRAKQGATKEQLIEGANYIRTSRPTAVNLMNFCDEIVQYLQTTTTTDMLEATEDIVSKLVLKEIDMNDAMAKHGASLIKNGENILTHCNTGSLATPGKGTALGVIKEAHLQGKNIHVYVDETRPLLQGGRLTAYELEREKIPYTLICDNMAATLMRQGKVNRVLVGADRIAVNGDFANKIGTYSVAVLANHHKIPFHTVAPTSTVDFECMNGDEIPIEERSKSEVHGYGPVRWAPANAKTFNPAFDVTPVELLESIILDSGVYTKEDIKKGNLKELKKK